MSHHNKSLKIVKDSTLIIQHNSPFTKAQRSQLVKQARAGKDLGAKGKNFNKIVAKAAAAGARNPQAVAGAAFWKTMATRRRK